MRLVKPVRIRFYAIFHGWNQRRISGNATMLKAGLRCAVLATAGLTTGLAPAAALMATPLRKTPGLTAQNSAVARVECLRKGIMNKNKWA